MRALLAARSGLLRARLGLAGPPPTALAGPSAVRLLASKSKGKGKGKGKGSQAQEGPIRVPELVNAEQLATLLGQPLPQLLEAAESVSEDELSPTRPLTAELIELLALEFEATVDIVSVDAQRRPPPSAEEKAKLPLRPPVVTLMGHVDHGKTSLLDAFRGSSIAAGEAGGITQAISAFTVEAGTPEAITFIDTPGHELFSAMRQRGATATDIVILVVAVNAGVQPTTVQAIEYATEMGTPVIVAANKIDRDGSDAALDKVGQQLLEHGLQVERFGGEAPMIGVSALKGTNLEELREQVLLQAEMLELHAEREGPAEGIVLEASPQKGLGIVSTVLVQRGKLRTSDFLVAGTTYGKVRMMQGEDGERVKEALPAMAVRLAGLRDCPSAGDELLVLPSETRAREVAEFRQRRAEFAKLDELNNRSVRLDRNAAEVPIVAAIVKADSQGALEALQEGVGHFPTNRVRFKPIRTGIGPLTEADVVLAASMGASVIGFGMQVPTKIEAQAEQADVVVHSHKVIYHVVDAVKDMLEAAIPPVYEDVELGSASVQQIFTLTLKVKERKAGMSKFTQVAGSKVISGEISRSAKVRVLRDEETIHEGAVVSLKHFKEDVARVKQGSDCGVILADFSDYQEGDRLSFYEVVPKKVGLYDADPRDSER